LTPTRAVFFFETPAPVDDPRLYAALAAVSLILLAMSERGATR
jgi:hypothetical protein